MSNEEFDKILAGKINDSKRTLESNALRAHGMDADEVKEIPPIQIEGFASNSAFHKLFRDLTYRASGYQMTRLMFSEKQLYAYSSTFDLTSYETSEITQEFFYEDISSIDVTINEVEYLKPRSLGFLIGCWIAILLGFLLFFIPTIIGVLLLIFAGHSRGIVKNLVLKITVPNDEFVCVMKPDYLNAIQGMKAKIREKKR